MAGGSKVGVYVAVGILSLLAAVLGFAAEATKVKESDIQVTAFGCSYPNTPANILGYIAALLVLIAQITISAVTRCVCCQSNTSNSGSPYVGAIICFVTSWVACVIGFALLISAANLSTRHEYLEAAGICYYVKPGIFATGGGFALFAGVIGLCAYRCSSKNNPQPTPVASAPYYQGGIAMGTPQFNNASTNPYTKQQHPYAV